MDANLLVLLVVGSASRSYIASHKRLQDYTVDDFDLLGLIISDFSEIILLPHVLAEASSLARQIAKPARGHIQEKLGTLTATAIELPIPSSSGVLRDEFDDLGLTDAVILHLCSVRSINPTLITSDSGLADRASSLGYSVIDYRREYQTA